MESKFSQGQTVIILKSILFQLDELVVRAGEVGVILEVESVIIDNNGTIIHDYIVKIGSKILFFFEEELAPYPNKE